MNERERERRRERERKREKEREERERERGERETRTDVHHIQAVMRSFANDPHRERGARAPYNTNPRAPGPPDTLINSIILGQCLKWLERLCSGGLAWFRAWFRPGSAWLCPSVCTQTPRASSFAAWFRPWFRLVPGALLGRSRLGCGAKRCRLDRVGLVGK